MTPIDVNIVLFALAIVVFAAFGFSVWGKHRSAKDYFHNDSLFKNAVSLTATNITLGTGLVYLITGAQHNGLLMLLVPLGVWLGYWLMAMFLVKATSVTARSGKNFLSSVDQLICDATGKPSPFARIVSGSLVFIYVLLLAFEIFASAKIIAPFLFKEPSVHAEVWLSIIVFCITILYTILGGIAAVLRVDVLQVPLVLLMIPVLFITAVPDVANIDAITTRLGKSLKLDSTVIAGASIAFVNAVATQFYSILNWGAVSHLQVENQQRLLKWVGAATAIILSVFVVVGLLHPVESGGQVWQDITQRYVDLAHGTGALAYLFSGVLLLGTASIVLTTTDAVVITSVMFWYDNVSRGDSKNVNNDPCELRRIRFIGAVTFFLCFAVLMTINYWQPDPFYLLLSMAGGVAVFAPMIAVAGYLTSREASLSVLTPLVVYAFFALFIAAGVISILLLIRQSPYVGYVGIVAFIISLFISISLIASARHLKTPLLKSIH